jgi:hypothetical protein
VAGIGTSNIKAKELDSPLAWGAGVVGGSIPTAAEGVIGGWEEADKSSRAIFFLPESVPGTYQVGGVFTYHAICVVHTTRKFYPDNATHPIYALMLVHVLESN